MQSYLVTLDFQIAYALCDPTSGRVMECSSDDVRLYSDGLMLRCLKKAEDDDKTRTYHCEKLVDADSEDGVADVLIGMFNHLPGFEVVETTVDPVKEETIPVGAATKEFVVVCRFRSAEAYFRLNNAFHAQVAEGLCFPAPGKPGEFVAYVVMRCPSSDGVAETVVALLREAFEANTDETADRFAEVTTNLLS